MGEYNGNNLFLAESSATTGGLDSLLEPTGNIKVAQDKAARAFGGDRSFFVHHRPPPPNKIIHRAARVLAGARPYYTDASPPTQYSMYGSLAIQPITDALKQLKAEGKLDRV